MLIREAEKHDLSGLLTLYTQLHDNDMPIISDVLENTWEKIIADQNHHIIVGLVGETVICSCVLIIVPNLTHNQRPYALIENVITHPDYRRNGYAAQLLNYAKEISANCRCYKIMLMTSSKLDSTLNFYERAGYNKNDKTAFIQWLE